MPHTDCIDCDGKACEAADIERTPPACARREEQEAIEEAQRIRTGDPTVTPIVEAADSVIKDGYGQWPRVQELIEFATRTGMRRLGIAFCMGLREEAESLVKILEGHGFELPSVVCSVNVACNPVGQALVLNRAKTDLNVVVGLCMGHDILFNRFSDAPTTTLVVKDRVTCHNPAGPLTNRYWRRRLQPEGR